MIPFTWRYCREKKLHKLQTSITSFNLGKTSKLSKKHFLQVQSELLSFITTSHQCFIFFLQLMFFLTARYIVILRVMSSFLLFFLWNWQLGDATSKILKFKGLQNTNDHKIVTKTMNLLHRFHSNLIPLLSFCKATGNNKNCSNIKKASKKEIKKSQNYLN